MVVGDTIVNNVNGRTYYVIGKSSVLDCSSKNVVYLISSNKCGVHYVGKTSQTLRSRLQSPEQNQAVMQLTITTPLIIPFMI